MKSLIVPEKLPINRDKLNILISGALPPPMGGMATYYQTLLNSSLPNRVDLHFVQTSTQNRELSSTGRATLSNLVSAIKDCWRFTRAILINRPQIAHISTAIGLSFVKHTYCIFIARILGSRVLLHPHCSLSVLYYERPKWWQWYFRQVIRMTNGVIALSKEWLELSSIMPGCQIFYLPNAIDIKLYQNVANKNLSRVKGKEPFRILYLGYLGEAKGSFDILKSAVDMRKRGISIYFDLVGAELTPGELILLYENVKKLKLEDILKIHKPAFGIDKLKYFQEADIFIYPSYYEGMPMAVLEAMACGLPVVATRIGGLPDLIHDGVNGILIKAGKPEQLTSALYKLVNDPGLCASMGKAGYQIATEQFDIEQHVTHLVSIYYKMVSN